MLQGLITYLGDYCLHGQKCPVLDQGARSCLTLDLVMLKGMCAWGKGVSTPPPLWKTALPSSTQGNLRQRLSGHGGSLSGRLLFIQDVLLQDPDANRVRRYMLMITVI